MRRLPFEYAVRNLGRSPLRLAMSLVLVGAFALLLHEKDGGTARDLVVSLVIAATAFVRGMENSLARSGSPSNVMLLGAGSEESIERSEIGMSVPTQAPISAMRWSRTVDSSS